MMYDIIKKFALLAWALIRFALSPIQVLFWGVDKALHFYIWAVAQMAFCLFGPIVVLGITLDAGLTAMILTGLAIAKEEIIDGWWGMGEKDLKDAYWSFKGVMWSLLLYLLVLSHLVK